MSIKRALEFIQQVRADEALRAQVLPSSQAGELEPIVRVGAGAGYDFTLEELRAAFKHDWGMRWMFYGAAGGEAQMLAAASETDE